MTTGHPQWTVRPAEARDADRWRVLYRGYADFYREPMDTAALHRLWSWLHDDAHPITGLVCTGPDDVPVGLAHYRAFPRPLGATTGLYLDDLFIDPPCRGSGAGAALLVRLREIAAERGLTVVRWITAPDNYQAQATYDRTATRTAWLTYDMAPVELSPPPR